MRDWDIDGHCVILAGEAEAIYRKAEATSKGIEQLSTALQARGGTDAAGLRIAEQYMLAFGAIAKAGNTVCLLHSPQMARLCAFFCFATSLSQSRRKRKPEGLMRSPPQVAAQLLWLRLGPAVLVLRQA